MLCSGGLFSSPDFLRLDKGLKGPLARKLILMAKKYDFIRYSLLTY